MFTEHYHRFWADMSVQTVYSQVSLLLFAFGLHLLDALFYDKTTWFNF